MNGLTQVAVIIATHNRPQLLNHRAISSVLNQTRLPNYLIIVDDSSKAFQLENRLIVEALGEKNIHTIYLVNNRTKGASGAWNTAIYHVFNTVKSSTDSLYLAFLDDDDEWHPNYLERCLAKANTNSYNMVAAGFYRHAPKQLFPTKNLPPISLVEDLFLRGNPGIQGSNLFLTLELILIAGGFDEHLQSCTDRDLCIRLCELKTTRYARIEDFLVNHFAETDRPRLSTPQSPSKSLGLDAFWLKYHGRMNDEQQYAFLTRAKELFSWQPVKKISLNFEFGIDDSCKNQVSIKSANETRTSFSLLVGVITNNAETILPLLNSIAEFTSFEQLLNVSTVILCNGCTPESLIDSFEHSRRAIGKVNIISEAQQICDAKNGLFGSAMRFRPEGQVGIAQARSMLQKYLGLAATEKPNCFVWVLDDDMRLDARAKDFLACLPQIKRANIDVVIGEYEGASPNPPLNGLRTHLVDLLHNLRWLNALPDDVELPDRSDENASLRHIYSDYYYDLSRKHSAHLEVPFWLEPAFQGETVEKAHKRLIANAHLLLSGFPLTRPIISSYSEESSLILKDSVNRGGNTFILNPKALLNTPNLIPKVKGREIRRSDMIWAMINRYHYGLSIKSAPFPIKHIDRVTKKQTLNLEKLQDEIMGSALYAGLQDFLQKNDKHNLIFTRLEIETIWQATAKAMKTRLDNLAVSFYRINGLAQALSNYVELAELTDYLLASFTQETFSKLENQVKQMRYIDIESFLSQLIEQVESFGNKDE